MQLLGQYIKEKWAHRLFSKRISLKKNLSYFNSLYQNIDGYLVSHEARGEEHQTSLTYGEVDFYSFSVLLALAKPSINDVFVDLGSGVGKACMTAALAFNLKHCRGIEIVPALHQQAMNVYEQCTDEVRQQLNFVCGDYLTHSFSDANIVYLNATALFGEQWLAIEERLTMHLSIHTRILISSKSLNSKHFKLLGMHAVVMDYGQGHVSLYQKR
tara:strand:+ start:90 stop:731 length:642 start_codon:yes stop_codon:yes gene_type:complete